MSFFQQLFEITQGMGVTIYAYSKNDRITLNVTPQAASTVAPVQIVGTPEELEAGFFQAIAVPMDAAKGLKVQTEEFNASVTKASAAAKPAKDVAPAGNEDDADEEPGIARVTAPAKKKADVAKPVVKEEPKEETGSLFS